MPEAKNSDGRGSILLALFGVTVAAAPVANKIRQTEVTIGGSRLKNFRQMEAIPSFLWNNLVCVKVRAGANLLLPNTQIQQYKLILEMNLKYQTWKVYCKSMCQSKCNDKLELEVDVNVQIEIYYLNRRLVTY